ncbi:MAG: acyl-CoA/acyl-ACP dehydrogenase [Actinobacteria bacterium]|nr:acyl-CoA/acyl-ACP dehydrogenase [Actinomycetota bacterium]
MELEFTADQDELRASVRSVLAGECPIGLVRDVVEKGVTADELWARMVELDWPGLTIAEEHGGLGLGVVELAVVLEELGRVIAPGPYFPTLSQFAPVIGHCGSDEQQARWLGAVARGELTGSVVFDGMATEAQHVDELVVSRADGSVVVVPREGCTVEPFTTFDRSRYMARVSLADDASVDPDRVLARPEGLAAAREEATAALAVEMVGTCQTIFDTALDYAKVREQFGVPIGSFQAIKHKFSDMYVALERARATAYYAVLTIAEHDDRQPIAVSMAKAAAGDAQRIIAQEGIQIMGGMGYTWEHDMHLYVKRAKSGDAILGSASAHRARVAELIGL